MATTYLSRQMSEEAESTTCPTDRPESDKLHINTLGCEEMASAVSWLTYSILLRLALVDSDYTTAITQQ